MTYKDYLIPPSMKHDPIDKFRIPTTKEEHKKSLDLSNYAKHRTIYCVVDGFTAMSTGFDRFNGKKYVEPLYIEKGTIFEFRYSYDCHCRDTSNNWFVFDPSILKLKCKKFGVINSKTAFNNKKNLREIILEGLYVKEEELVWQIHKTN